MSVPELVLWVAVEFERSRVPFGPGGSADATLLLIPGTMLSECVDAEAVTVMLDMEAENDVDGEWVGAGVMGTA